LTVFDEQALFRSQGLTIGGEGNVERVAAVRATPSLFRLLRIRAYRGRVFTHDEGEIGHEHKVVLSYALWQRRFAGRDDAVGKDLRVNGTPYTIVGVLPRDLHFFSDSDEPLVWVPAAFTPQEKSDDARHNNSWTMIGRLKMGATIEQARQQMDALNASNLERFPNFKEILLNAGFTTKVVYLQDDLIRDVRATLYLLWAGALFVMLIGAVNVANLVMVRASARLKEMAMRHALGAGIGRLASQVLTETTLLTLMSGAIGLVLGSWTLSLIRSAGIEGLPRAAEIRLDGTAFAYALALSALIGLALGAVPIFGIRRTNLSQAFREEGRSSSGGRRARLVRGTLVTAQVAIALVLLAGSSLLLASFRRVLAVDPGFTPAGVITARVAAPQTRYADDPALRTFAARVLERVRAIPGVASVGTTDSIPFGGDFNTSVILAEGYQMAPGESIVAPAQITVSEGMLETLKVPLVRGRLFEPRDTDTSMRVVIVDERMARKFWPGQDPIGKRMFRPDNPTDLISPTEKTRFLTVVGVVREVKLLGLVSTEGNALVGTCYFPAPQDPFRNLTLAIRTTSADSASLVPAVRRELAAIDPELPVYDVKTMDERIATSLDSRRTPMYIALAFAVVALFLATIGIYGVLAYQVSQRTREIAIRMALGSEASSVFRLVVRDGMVMVGVGMAVGLAGALAVGRALQSQLYEVRPLEPGVLSLVAALLALVALVACLVPAARAARVSPVQALTEL
jgi:predicted permease